MTTFQKVSRISFLILIGIILIFLTWEASIYFHKYQALQEEKGLLSIDLSVAKILSRKESATILNRENKKYQELLSKYQETVVEYVNYKATFKYSSQQIVQNVTSIIENPTIGTCTDNKFTVDDCYVLLASEKFDTQHSDSRITIKDHLEREGGPNWRSSVQYLLHQKFKFQQLKTVDKNGTPRYHGNLYEISGGDGGTDLLLQTFEYTVALEDDKKLGMHWIAPTVTIGVRTAYHLQDGFVVGAQLGAYLSKYTSRVSKRDAWHFFGLGIGVNSDRKFFGYFAPFAFNVGHRLPILNDIWIAPTVAIDHKAGWSFGLSLESSL
jgi:hypothetical protein